MQYLTAHIFTYLLTYSMEQSSSSEANWFSASQEIPRSYATRRYITAFTTARHLSLSWARPIQSIPPNPTSWWSILILSFHLRLDLQSGLLPLGIPTKTLYTPLLYHTRATCPAHLIILDFITRLIFGEHYRSLSSPSRIFLHYPVTSSLIAPNIPPNTLFSNTLSLRSSLNVSDQVSHPYKITGKTVVLYILMFKFLDS